jgi:cytochrome c553
MKKTGNWSALLLLMLILTSSWKTKKTPVIITDKLPWQSISKAERLFNQKCMICHNTEGKTAETMLAPPFFQVKKRYLMASMDKDDFINTMTNWVKNPSKENALMRGAVQQLNVMPKLGYSEEDIKIISQYIYENDMPKPKWFDAHQASHRKQMNH